MHKNALRNSEREFHAVLIPTLGHPEPMFGQIPAEYINRNSRACDVCDREPQSPGLRSGKTSSCSKKADGDSSPWEDGPYCSGTIRIEVSFVKYSGIQQWKLGESMPSWFFFFSKVRSQLPPRKTAGQGSVTNSWAVRTCNGSWLSTIALAIAG